MSNVFQRFRAGVPVYDKLGRTDTLPKIGASLAHPIRAQDRYDDNKMCISWTFGDRIVKRFALLWVVLAISAIGQQTSAQPPVVSGFEIVWFDAFNGSELDLTKWTPVFNIMPTNSSLQAYLPDNVFVGNGNMIIVSTDQPFGQFDYRSGQIISTALSRFGRFEIRADLPTSRGMWPAIWLLPDSPPFWPSQGEIDIMENRGNESFLTSSAFHWGTNPPFNHNFVFAENETFQGGEYVNYHDSFHVYAAEWDPKQIRFYVDGVHYFTVRDSNVGNFLTNSQTNPMRLIINTAIGGTFLPDPDATTQWPQLFEVDYVYVYERTGDPVLGLENQNFDLNGGSLSGWSLFGNSANNVRSDDQHVLAGDGSLKVFGQLTPTQNFSGVEQGVSVLPGDELAVSVSSFIDSTDSIAGTGNQTFLKIDFYNTLYGAFGTNEYISSQQVLLADGSTVNNQWVEKVLLASAPAGAVEARVAIVFRQINNAPGSVRFDELEFENRTATILVNPTDVQVIKGAIAGGSLADTTASDDEYLEVIAANTDVATQSPIQLTFSATSPFDDPADISFLIEGSSNTIGLNQTIEAFNFETGSFEPVASQLLQLADAVFANSLPGDVSRFVNDSNNQMIIRISADAVTPALSYPWSIRLDQVAWTVNR